MTNSSTPSNNFEQINNVPAHIAIIMDGNGRWAKSRGKIRLEGHKAGGETVQRVLTYCKKYGIKYVTLYAFSTENWNRPLAEVTGLMTLLNGFLKNREKDIIKEQFRFRVIGRRTDLPEKLQKRIAEVEEKTKHFTDNQLIVALSYGGRAEITDAFKKMGAEIAAGRLDPASITESSVASYLYAPDVPDPDLVIRTSGELRLSNFLIWEAAYSEIYVTDVLWPDFNEEDFVNALKAFSTRKRRFGGLKNA